jgi:hypothetical protein
MMANLLAKYGGADAKMLEYDPLSDPNYDTKTKSKPMAKKPASKAVDPSRPVKKLKKAKS